MKLHHLTPLIAPALALGATAVIASQMHSCHSVNGLPDKTCTPGVVRTTDKNDICTIKTSTIRPPASYTSKLKLEQMRAYGLSGDPSEYEEDHLISLTLGGDPTDPKNLWPEFGNSPNQKDKVEVWLHKQICDGNISVTDAQQGIATNWKQYLSQMQQ